MAINMMPWEQGVMGFIFGSGRDGLAPEVFGWSGPVPPDLPPLGTNADEPRHEPLAGRDEGEPDDMQSAVFLAKMDKKNFRFSSLAKEQGKMRQRALVLWASILAAIGPASILFKQMKATESEDERAEMLRDATLKRATSTLLQRAYQMLAFIRWASPLGVGSAFPVTEAVAYQYIRWLRAVKAAPSRATSFIQALSLSNHLLDITGGGSIKSARVLGAAEDQWMRKRVRRPRDPLTKGMLSVLEDLVFSHKDRRTRIFVGFVVAMVHWRARLSDALFPREEPQVDYDPEGVPVFIECQVDSDKTKTGGSRKRARQMVHLVGMAQGIRSKPWAEKWLADRASAKLDAGCDGTLMPTPNKGGFWKDRPMKNEELTLWLREVLTLTGFSLPSLMNVGMHTPKHTLLSWCSKFGVLKDTRRDLGGHVQAADKSVAAYSRDLLAGPLRELAEVLQAVTDGSFDPDATRSGRFRPAVQQMDKSKCTEVQTDKEDEDDAFPPATEPAGTATPAFTPVDSPAEMVPDMSDPFELFVDEEWSQPSISPFKGVEGESVQVIEGESTPCVSEIGGGVPELAEEDVISPVEGAVPTELADSDTDDGPTSADETDDCEFNDEAPLPDSDEDAHKLEHTEDENEEWYTKDTPYWYTTEKATQDVIADPVGTKTLHRDEPMPQGGLWVHRVWGTLHLRADCIDGGSCEKLKCGRRGIFTTYVKVDGWLDGAVRCKQCFP